MSSRSEDLAGRLVVVTGAAGNMGQALCSALADEGARIWAIDHSPDAIASLAARLGTAVRGAPCDLRDEAAIEQNLDEAGAAWAMVHTVGGFRAGNVSSSTAADFDAMVDLNLRTAFLVTRAALRRMSGGGGGRIVTVGAYTAALAAGMAGAALYNASKAAVIALSRAADEEGRAHNVRACCIAPNTIDTPRNRADMPDVDPATWVSLGQVTEAILACLRPSSGLGGLITLPGGGHQR